MARINPTIAEQIMIDAGLIPLESFRGGDYPWLSKCVKCGREVSPRFRHVRDRKSGCKYCSGKATIVSEVLDEMKGFGLTPLEDYPGANKKWKSRCNDCGKEVEPRIADIRMGHSGCIHCSRKSQGIKRRLSSSDVEMDAVLMIMSEANLEPLEPYSLSNAKWKCRCTACDSVVTPSYSQILGGSGGCKKCAYKKIGDRTRLDQQVAWKRMVDSNWEPLENYVGANKPWKCKCLDCGNVSTPTYAHIQQGRKGCKTCGYRKNTDAKRMPEAVANEIATNAGFIPLETFKGRHYPWKCRCNNCNQVVYPYLGGILGGNGCLNCSGLVINPDEARELMIKNKVEPIVEYPGAGVPWQSRCMKCDREVYPRYSSVKMNIGGCKYCASYGYDFSSPGILYLLTHLELESHKIGITNVNAKEKRLEKHSKRGWVVYETWSFVNGNNAFEVEQALLSWFREDLNLPVCLGKAQMPQGGFTETVDSKEIDLSEIANMAHKLADRHRGSSKHSDFRTSMPRKKKG
jgi:recombinational DNA repair protein (RecF pathway)